ncbi:MAG: hypothetical protein C4346_11140, partial [Chloroflexota bacterium]
MNNHATPTTNAPSQTSFRRVLVPLDGSRLAEAAIPPAIRVASRASAAVTLLHVIEATPPGTVHGERHLATPADAAAYLDRIRARFAAAGVPAAMHVHAEPARDVAGAIVAHASELDADLIVLASHGSGGIRGFFFGRVAQQVVRRGTQPVLMVQVDTGDDPDQPFACHVIALALSGAAEAEAAVAPAVRLARALDASL